MLYLVLICLLACLLSVRAEIVMYVILTFLTCLLCRTGAVATAATGPMTVTSGGAPGAGVWSGEPGKGCKQHGAHGAISSLVHVSK